MRPERIRFYKKVFPNVDDIVIGKVVKIDHYVHVELLEYENREAFISFDELSTKSIKNINSVVKLGGIYPLLTICVDTERGYIDLSNKYITNHDSHFDKYSKYKIVHNLFHKIANKLLEGAEGTDNESESHIYLEMLENLATRTIWKHKYSTIHDLFVDIAVNENLTDYNDVFDFENDTEKSIFYEFIKKYIKCPKYKIRLHFTLKCIGVDAISNIRAFFEQLMCEFGGSDVEPRDRIKILSEGSPNYTIGLPESKHKNSRIALLTKIGERMREIAETNKLFIFTMKNDAIDVCVKK